ncbi:MAG TPA: hypothetical protein VN906_06705 [Candidatus Sulfotelmatobacter sp.]|nr:hypothetical protein [Candidatus Sulfotelmatobacter sp.]
MKAKSLMVALAAVVAMLLFGSGTASANVAWCIFDPPAHVVTPGGTHITVNNTVWLPQSAADQKDQVWDEASAQSDGSGGTLISVTVHLPDGVASHVVSTVHRFHVSTEADGQTSVFLYLDVPTP